MIFKLFPLLLMTFTLHLQSCYLYESLKRFDIYVLTGSFLVFLKGDLIGMRVACQQLKIVRW